MDYFDYEKIAREAAISPEDLKKIREFCREDYPTDDMLFELYALRVCRLIRDGRLTMEEITSPQLAEKTG